MTRDCCCRIRYSLRIYEIDKAILFEEDKPLELVEVEMSLKPYSGLGDDLGIDTWKNDDS